MADAVEPTNAELIAEVLRLDGEATRGPWHEDHEVVGAGNERESFVVVPEPAGGLFLDARPTATEPKYEWTLNRHVEQAIHDARLIAFYRAAAPSLARRLAAAEATHQREVELGYRRCGEGSRRSPKGDMAHGMGDDFGALEGCDVKYHLAAQLYRCASCDVAFCKVCLLKHFAKSGNHADAQVNAIESWIEKVRSLTEQLAAAEARLESAMRIVKAAHLYRAAERGGNGDATELGFVLDDALTAGKEV